MLLKFRFKNYKSFVEEAVLDMTTRSIEDHQSRLITINKINVSPVAIITGKNARGKSNIFQAIETMKNEIIYSNINNNQNNITPYYFDEKYRTQPTEFEVTIYLKNQNKEYRYGFLKTNIEVYKEWLFSKSFSNTKIIKEKCIFFREKNNKSKFDLNDQEEINELLFINSIIKSNELLLTILGKRETTKYSDVYKWFKSNIIIINSYNSYESFEINNQKALKQLYENKEQLKKIEKIVKTIDTSIKGIKIKEDVDDNMNIYYKVLSKHINSNNEIIFVPFTSESSGIKKLFSIELYINNSLNKGTILLIDDLDSKLNTLVTQYIIEQYHDKNSNVNNGQIIFSSHNITYLDSCDVRKDKIWSVEKNDEGSIMILEY